jgi:hypothetical protein
MYTWVIFEILLILEVGIKDDIVVVDTENTLDIACEASIVLDIKLLCLCQGASLTSKKFTDLNFGQWLLRLFIEFVHVTMER